MIGGGGCFAISVVLNLGKVRVSDDNDLMMLAGYAVFAGAIPFVFQATRFSGIDRSIGELSYPLYLVHGRGQAILFSIIGWPQGKWLFTLATVSISVLAAIVLWLLVERPCEIWRQRAAVPHKAAGVDGAIPVAVSLPARNATKTSAQQR